MALFWKIISRSSRFQHDKMRPVCNTCHNRAGFGVTCPHAVRSTQLSFLAIIFQLLHFPQTVCVSVSHCLAILSENPKQRVHRVDILKLASILFRMSWCLLTDMFRYRWVQKCTLRYHQQQASLLDYIFSSCLGQVNTRLLYRFQSNSVV